MLKKDIVSNVVVYRPIKCPQCGSKKVKCHTSKPPIRYHKCKACGYNFRSIEIKVNKKMLLEENKKISTWYRNIIIKKREKMSKRMSGPNSISWKGGRIKDSRGYIWIHQKNHPHANKWGYVYEHRLVMEKHLGRYLELKEIVHHKGTRYHIGSIENRGDNRIKNLQLFKNNAEHHKHHKKLRATT